MIKDEALDLALEALEYIENNYMSLPKSGSEAITAIKQARSAPVQEPVAFNAGVPPLYPEMKDGETISVEYTNPPAAQKDIQRLSALVRAQQITIDKLEQARSAPVQEPVNWSVYNSGAEVASGLTFSEAWDYLTPERLARQWCAVCVVDQSNMPATPPAAQRQRVSLTDEEIEAIWYDHHDREMGYAIRFARAIEAKLMEKNGGVV